MTLDPSEAVKETVGIVGAVIKVAAENPDARRAGGQLGRAALTVTKAINNALLPLAAVNFAFDKARTYFETAFEADVAARLAEVPDEHVAEPKASVAGPALQGLAFSHEEPDLKAMYLSLLGTAMDARVAAEVHPAFVEIIRQIDAEEARLLRTVLNRPTGSALAIVELRIVVAGPQSGWRTLGRNVMNIVNLSTQEPAEIPRLPAMIDNWVRLGLVSVEYGKFLLGEDAYAWVTARPEYLRFSSDPSNGNVVFEKGILAPTALGAQFAGVVGIL